MYAGERQSKEPALQKDWSDLSQFVNRPISLHQGGLSIHQVGAVLRTSVVISAHPLQCHYVTPALFLSFN